MLFKNNNVRLELLQSIEDVSGLPLENQCVGEVFLGIQKTFSQTYGYYFRTIEEMHDLIEKVELTQQKRL